MTATFGRKQRRGVKQSAESIRKSATGRTKAIDEKKLLSNIRYDVPWASIGREQEVSGNTAKARWAKLDEELMWAWLWDRREDYTAENWFIETRGLDVSSEDFSIDDDEWNATFADPKTEGAVIEWLNDGKGGERQTEMRMFLGWDCDDWLAGRRQWTSARKAKAALEDGLLDLVRQKRKENKGTPPWWENLRKDYARYAAEYYDTPAGRKYAKEMGAPGSEMRADAARPLSMEMREVLGI